MNNQLDCLVPLEFFWRRWQPAWRSQGPVWRVGAFQMWMRWPSTVIGFSCSVLKARDSPSVSASKCVRGHYRTFMLSSAAIQSMFGTNRLKTLPKPKSDHGLIVLVVCIDSRTASVVGRDIASFRERTKWARNIMVSQTNLYLFSLTIRPVMQNRVKKCLDSLICAFQLFQNDIISFRCIRVSCQWSVERIMFIAIRNVPGAFSNLNHTLINFINPCRDGNAVFSFSSLAILASQQANFAFNIEKIVEFSKFYAFGHRWNGTKTCVL